MFPSYICESPLRTVINEFVSGKMDITEFVALYNKDDNLEKYLDSVIDYIATHNIPIKRRTVLMKKSIKISLLKFVRTQSNSLKNTHRIFEIFRISGRTIRPK